MRIIKHQTGDTIIEVMIAVAVLGLVIVGGYSIATRSLNGVRIAQERAEATKLAEGQLEALKYEFAAAGSISKLIGADKSKLLSDLIDINNPIPFGIDSVYFASLAATQEIGFCFGVNGAPKRFYLPSGGLEDFASYPNECKERNNFYHIYTATNIQAGTPNFAQYTVNITWERSGGGGFETLQLFDRLTIDDGIL